MAGLIKRRTGVTGLFLRIQKLVPIEMNGKENHKFLKMQ